MKKLRQSRPRDLLCFCFCLCRAVCLGHARLIKLVIFSTQALVAFTCLQSHYVIETPSATPKIPKISNCGHRYSAAMNRPCIATSLDAAVVGFCGPPAAANAAALGHCGAENSAGAAGTTGGWSSAMAMRRTRKYLE